MPDKDNKSKDSKPKKEKSITYHLTHAARLQRARSGRLLMGLGLFPGQETVLELLNTQESMTMSALAETLRVRPPTASKTIARLKAQGLVDRKTTKEDQRLVRVSLTEDGRQRALQIEAIKGDLEKEIIDGLDGKDKKRLRKLLRKVQKNLMEHLGVETPEDADLADELENEAED